MAEIENEATTSEPTESRQREELPPAEALARLRAGKALENVRVERLVLRGEFPLPVTLKNCTLVRPNFNKTVFQAEVAITGSTLDRPNFGDSSEFQQGLNLSGSTVNKMTLARAAIKGTLNLSFVIAKGKLLLTDCQVEGKVNAWELHVDGWFDCKDCRFGDEVDMRSVHIDQGLNLRDCTFAKDLLLRGAVVCKKVELNGSRFEGMLDLSKAKLHDFVYLEQIVPGSGQRFAFLNAVAERIRVEPEQLEGRLASEETGRYEDAMHEYGVLKRSFNTLHRFDQEDWAFYRFKVNQRRAGRRSWLRPWTKLRQLCDWLFLDLGCGYGTNPSRAVRTALLIIVGFALIYFAGIEMFHIDEEKLPFPGRAITDLPNRLMISLMLSVSVFISGLSGIRDLAQSWMNVPIIVESLMGTLLWGLFIVAFSRKVIR
jgi:hypothetical protein